MIKPNVFFVGAPKCGTTSIAENLATHPNIFVCNPKEPHFFEFDIDRGIKSLKSYKELFKYAKFDERVVLEASTGYLYSETAVNEIIKYNKDAKFIVILRNPHDMAISLHTHAIRGGYEDISSFSDAWLKQNDRANGKGLPYSCVSSRMLMYKDRCSVGSQLKNLLDKVDSNKVKVLFFDDLKNEPEKLYEDIFSFLKVENIDINFNKKSNSKRKSIFPLLNIFIRKLGKIKRSFGLNRSWKFADKVSNFFTSKIMTNETINEDVKLEMKVIFNREIEIIEKLTSRNLKEWKK